jgi:hypothetical protein
VLAWQFLGLNGRERLPDVIVEQLDQATTLGYPTMLLSSEEFSRALVANGSFRHFAPVCDMVHTELVITLRPLQERIYSELQELIKNGQRLDLANAHDVLDALMTRPGLRPDFLVSAITESKAARITIVLVDSEVPDRLFKSMSAIVGEDLGPPRNMSVNVSYPFIKALWLNTLNRYSKLPVDESRALVTAAFDAVQNQLSSIPYPPLPAAVQRYADGLWAQQMAYLGELESLGRLRII